MIDAISRWLGPDGRELVYALFTAMPYVLPAFLAVFAAALALVAGVRGDRRHALGLLAAGVGFLGWELVALGSYDAFALVPYAFMAEGFGACALLVSRGLPRSAPPP